MAQLVVDPAIHFVDEPYVLGSSRSSVIELEALDDHDRASPINLTQHNDRIEIHIAKNFAEPSEETILRFSSTGDAPAIVKTGTQKPNQFTWTIPFTARIPAGELQWRCWRIQDPGTPQEFREALWTETFLAVR